MTYTVLVHSTDETYEGEGYDRWMWSRIEYRAMYDHILSDLRGLSPDRAHLINSVHASRAMALELSKYNCVVFCVQDSWRRNIYLEFSDESDFIHFKLRWG